MTAHSFAWNTEADEVLQAFGKHARDKTIVITGASENSLGAWTAIALAKTQPKLIIVTARSQGKIAPVISKIQEISPTTETAFVSLDLADFNDVRRAAKDINECVSSIDILINNAGIMAVPFSKNNAGIELTFATDHLGPFILTNELMPKILAAAPGARIINVSSHGHRAGGVRFDDYNFEDGEAYNRWLGYGQAKTANILHAQQLASLHGKSGVYSFSLHPGAVPGTSLGTHLTMDDIMEAIAASEKAGTKPPGPMKSQNQGISTTLVAALDPSIEKDNGAFLEDCQIGTVEPHAREAADAERLWSLSEKLVA